MKKKKLILVLCCFLASLQAKEWQAPGEALLPEARLHHGWQSEAKWLWNGKIAKCLYAGQQLAPDNALEDLTGHFRMSLHFDEPVKKAWFYSWLDNKGVYYVNGREAKGSALPKSAIAGEIKYYDITGAVRQGKNVLAVKVVNDWGLDGRVILRGAAELRSGRKVDFCTGPHCKMSLSEIPGWQELEFDDSAWPEALVCGDLQSMPYNAYVNMAEYFCSPGELQEYCQRRQDGSAVPEEKLAVEPAVSGKIVYTGKLPAFEFNGELYPAVYHCDPTPGNDGDDNLILKFRRAGIRIFAVEMTPAYTGYMPPFRFKDIDWRIRRILHLVPDAKIFLRVRFDDYAKANALFSADDLTGYANPVPGVNDLSGAPAVPSPASDKFRRTLGGALADFAAYAKKQPWGNRLSGVFIDYVSDFTYPGCNLAMPDTGKAMTERFRAFLRTKYQTDAALSKAWGEPSARLNTACVPDKTERQGQGFYLKEPANPSDCRIRDYYICHNEVFADFLLSLARSCKQNLPGRLVGFCHGYTFNGYPPTGENSWIEKILKSPDVDYLWGTCAKTGAGGYITYSTRYLSSRFRTFGKMVVWEVDVRTHAQLKRGSAEVKTPEESKALLRAILGNTIFEGTGVHFTHFRYPDWYNSPEILNAVHEYFEVLKRLRELPPSPQTEAVIVYNPDEKVFNGHPVQDNRRLQSPLYLDMPQALALTGRPYEFMHYRDFLKSDRQYKLTVLANMFTVSDFEREQLRKKLNRPGATAIWLYAPGYISGGVFSEKAMESLTGIRLKAQKGEYSMAITLNSGEKIDTSPESSETLRFHCIDSDAEILGRYNDGKAALAEKLLPSGMRSLFIGFPVTDISTWAKLFDRAGVHRYVSEPIYLRADGNLLLLHAPRAGNYHVNLPGKAASVTELYSGKILFRDCKEFVLNPSGAETFLLRLEYSPPKKGTP